MDNCFYYFPAILGFIFTGQKRENHTRKSTRFLGKKINESHNSLEPSHDCQNTPRQTRQMCFKILHEKTPFTQMFMFLVYRQVSILYSKEISSLHYMCGQTRHLTRPHTQLLPKCLDIDANTRPDTTAQESYSSRDYVNHTAGKARVPTLPVAGRQLVVWCKK